MGLDNTILSSKKAATGTKEEIWNASLTKMVVLGILYKVGYLL